MNTILKVKNLSVQNNYIDILKDISFDIKKGEILGIVWLFRISTNCFPIFLIGFNVVPGF